MVSFVPSNDLLLPEGARLLHIGPQKTGTTGIQTAMHRSRDVLREHGVVYPGKGTRPRKAVWSLLGSPEGKPDYPITHWQQLVQEVQAAGDLRVCLSTEDWARTDLDGATTTIEGLGGDRAHVIASARRLDRLFPSQWQQRVKMRRITLSYEEWLERVLGEDRDNPVWRNIWIPHDIQGVAERWAKAAGGPDRFTLVIADETDRELLPRVFENMLGLPSGLLSAAVTDVRNQSISYGRTEAIRHLTEVFGANGWGEGTELEPLYRRLIDAYKSTAPSQDEAKIPALPAWAAERVAELNEQRVETVRRLGVRVVGDPENLRAPGPLPTSDEIKPGTISSELSAKMIEKAVEALLDQRVEDDLVRRRQIRKLRKRIAHARSVRTIDEAPARELARTLAGRALRRLQPRR